jgi:hypothetical protein
MYVKIKIELGNDAMKTSEDVVQALTQLALDLSQSGVLFVGKTLTIPDINGNKVGALKVKE